MDGILAEGFSLLLFGMGFVVVFLTLLVFATSLMSRILVRFEPAPLPVAAKKTGATAGATAGAAAGATAGAVNDPALIAVLSAAVKKYREDRNSH